MARYLSTTQCTRLLRPIAVTLMGAWLLTGCGSAPVDPGLLKAPRFADESGRLARPWRFAHHASTDSYRLELRDGIASIDRVGHEPWALLAQPIPPETLPSLAGRRLAFSMDVRARLENDTFGPPLKPTALTVQTWLRPGSGSSSPLNAMLGPRQAETQRLALPSAAHIPDWERYTLEFTVPENVSRMEVAVMMTSGGRLELRNPSLHPL